jgi:hypothetical protein
MENKPKHVVTAIVQKCNEADAKPGRSWCLYKHDAKDHSKKAAHQPKGWPKTYETKEAAEKGLKMAHVFGETLTEFEEFCKEAGVEIRAGKVNLRQLEAAVQPVTADTAEKPLGKTEMLKMLKELEFDINEALEEKGIKTPNKEEVKVVPRDYNKPFSQEEEYGEVYHYPESIGFNINSGTTFKMDLLANGKIIPEGRNLSGAGITREVLIEKVVQDVLNWANRALKSTTSDLKNDAYDAFTHLGKWHEQEKDFVATVVQAPEVQVKPSELWVQHKEDLGDLGEDFQIPLEEALAEPIIVLDVGTKKYVLDGNHRLQEHLKEGHSTVPAVVVKLGDFEAGRQFPEEIQEELAQFPWVKAV